MSLAEVFQLYAPLAGLLAMAFWSCVLTQRVRALEAQLSKLDGDGNGDRLVRLETQMGTVLDEMKSINRNMSGVQRQLGNISARGFHDLSGAVG